jgi:hypothetical protein
MGIVGVLACVLFAGFGFSHFLDICSTDLTSVSDAYVPHAPSRGGTVVAIRYPQSSSVSPARISRDRATTDSAAVPLKGCNHLLQPKWMKNSLKKKMYNS